MAQVESTNLIAAAEQSDPGLFTTIVSFFQDGGAFMYPIMIVFIFGLAIAVERFIFLNLMKAKNQSAWKKLLPILNQGNFRQAMEVASSSKSAVGRILAYGLSKVGKGRRHDDLEMAMEEGLMEILPRLEKRTPYLATFANIATLLGLLGTILGLIKAFTAVANVDPAEKANILSASISIAMNTTAFGLMAAIPLLLAFTFLQTKTTEIVDSIEMASVKFVNLIRDARPSESAKTPASKPKA
ncbi:MotA/TolQ/ExbB proton channel family protein [Aliikangiella coralliicola]|uniref:MotA/TolQ/ExbB proton channel family protein n=1 Tax=Aliikangiella coralliicola TaxID=2592383 RepID=A0A545U4Z4_9GAMM|nr:MotA/TolQ/ExbB proton channel family protein [Aliikangiella coralliicola]TQV84539.1 MotA/TolQ/ExbB proton channel family protein [Aliikangiella coralliicola]